MRLHWQRLQQGVRAFLEWTALGVGVGLLCGLASALFLFLLERVTALRLGHHELVWALPVAGLVLGTLQARWGASVRGGTSLILDTLHEDRGQLPLRMAPLVLGGTVLTHLFGGSAGREGTAVQMGASLADALSHGLKVGPGRRRALLAAGMAGGFGAVFGTPVAGTVFGLEVLAVGRIEYAALLPSLVAALVGDAVVRGLGVHHSSYALPGPLILTLPVAGKWVLVGLAVAATAFAFIELTHGLKRRFEQWLPRLPVRMAVGGAGVLGLWWLCGTDAYLGLGVPGIQRAFVDAGLPPSAFLWKLVFTAVTLGAGFLGGEVTPLFFVGASLGNLLARALGLPLELTAGVCMAALFGAASNTPLALSLMAVELLGAPVLPHVLFVTVVAYLATGHRSIYPAQRLAWDKAGGASVTGVRAPPGLALRDLGHGVPPEPGTGPKPGA